MARLTVRREVPFLAAVTIQPPTGDISVGDVLVFTASGVDQYGDPFPVSDGVWASSGQNVASVEASGGTATGLSEGEVDITYTVNGQTFA